MSRREQPWLRLYTNILENPKVQRLKPEVFRAWVNVLALYKRNNEVMPPIDEIAFALRCSEKDARRYVAELVKAGLLDEADDGLMPHNWDDRQFSSDTSKERQRAYRERHKQRHGDGGSDALVTSQGTDSDVTVTALVTTQERARSDSESESEADTESEPEEEPPNPLRASGAPRRFAPPDWVPADAWRAFEQHRQRMRKPLTDHARTLIVRKLEDLQSRGHDPRQLIDTAIERGWQTVFEPRPDVQPIGDRATAKAAARTQANFDTYQQVISEMFPNG